MAETPHLNPFIEGQSRARSRKRQLHPQEIVSSQTSQVEIGPFDTPSRLRVAQIAQTPGATQQIAAILPPGSSITVVTVLAKLTEILSVPAEKLVVSTGKTVAIPVTPQSKLLKVLLGKLQQLVYPVAAIQEQLNVLSENVDTVVSSISLLSSEVALLQDNIHGSQILPRTSSSRTYAETVGSNSQAVVINMPQVRSKLAENSIILSQINPSEKHTMPDQFQSKKTILLEALYKQTELRGIEIRAINILASQDIRVIFASEEQAATVKKYPEWTDYLTIPYYIKKEVWGIIIHMMPYSLDLKDQDVKEEFCNSNPELQLSTNTLSWQWSNPKAKERSSNYVKHHSSVIIDIHNQASASLAIKQGVIWDSRQLRVERSIRPVRQCFKCLRFGHTAARCFTPIRCGRCASKEHETKNCPCSEDLCPSIKECTHYIPQCALCLDKKQPQVAHTAFDRKCPSYKQVYQQVLLARKCAYIPQE